MTSPRSIAVGPGPAIVVLLVAFNLRGALIALAPVMEQVRRDTGFSTAAAGLLMTLPVLCFALFSPVAPRLARRWGIEAVLVAAMAVLAVGVLLRSAATGFALIAGTVILGAAIAIGNVLLPALVKRDFPGRIGLMTGAYVTIMSAGATLAAGTTILIQRASGLSWPGTLVLWAIPAIAGMGACLLRSPARDDGSIPVAPGAGGLRRDSLAWHVTLFMGLQSLIFYSSVAWLPTLFFDSGFTEADAGLLLGLMNLVGLPASLAAPVLAGRRATQTGLVLGTSALTGAGLLGIIVQPTAAPVLWMVLLGLGQGAAIGLALSLIGLRAADSEYAARLSSMAQSIGYLIAAFGPFLLGAIYELTGSWRLAFVVTLVALIAQILSGWGASRDRQVGRPREA
ncbi:MAG: hypothetical protein AVDCRST_MAG65-1565 [uncultured Solirubrobacteraceae bacterium]|uniref:Major facilitator superfamily (MFS) profile domain-containing protein n=1 Tax=uncultured Solirubrobacteraceae bacterium TaxID=1162706 RepID=A0A6J4S1N5_9ACTN|nr:MAG: hypothetical protein AVDCRST_MAG65-1565 [uncultured Solirubrobacteraceae bacterium]